MGCVGIGVRKDKGRAGAEPPRDRQSNVKGFYRSVRQKVRVTKPLSRILEMSWQSGEVTGDWKKGNIAPFFRKGGKEDPGNTAMSASLCAGKVLDSPSGSSADAGGQEVI